MTRSHAKLLKIAEAFEAGQYDEKYDRSDNSVYFPRKHQLYYKAGREAGKRVNPNDPDDIGLSL